MLDDYFNRPQIQPVLNPCWKTRDVPTLMYDTQTRRYYRIPLTFANMFKQAKEEPVIDENEFLQMFTICQEGSDGDGLRLYL